MTAILSRFNPGNPLFGLQYFNVFLHQCFSGYDSTCGFKSSDIFKDDDSCTFSCRTKYKDGFIFGMFLKKRKYPVGKRPVEGEFVLIFSGKTINESKESAGSVLISKL